MQLVRVLSFGKGGGEVDKKLKEELKKITDKDIPDQYL